MTPSATTWSTLFQRAPCLLAFSEAFQGSPFVPPGALFLLQYFSIFFTSSSFLFAESLVSIKKTEVVNEFEFDINYTQSEIGTIATPSTLKIRKM